MGIDVTDVTARCEAFCQVRDSGKHCGVRHGLPTVRVRLPGSKVRPRTREDLAEKVEMIVGSMAAGG